MRRISLTLSTGVMGFVLIVGCGGSSTAPRPTAVVQMNVNPPTVAPVVCPPSHCGTLGNQFEVEATLTIRETAGVSITVSRIGLTLRRQSDNASLATGEVVNARGGRISANGSAAFQVAMHFDMALAQPNMKVVIVLEATDDNSHSTTSTAELEVRM
jgi:hypothetical protein